MESLQPRSGNLCPKCCLDCSGLAILSLSGLFYWITYAFDVQIEILTNTATSKQVLVLTSIQGSLHDCAPPTVEGVEGTTIGVLNPPPLVIGGQNKVGMEILALVQ